MGTHPCVLLASPPPFHLPVPGEGTKLLGSSSDGSQKEPWEKPGNQNSPAHAGESASETPVPNQFRFTTSQEPFSWYYLFLSRQGNEGKEQEDLPKHNRQTKSPETKLPPSRCVSDSGSGSSTALLKTRASTELLGFAPSRLHCEMSRLSSVPTQESKGFPKQRHEGLFFQLQLLGNFPLGRDWAKQSPGKMKKVGVTWGRRPKMNWAAPSASVIPIPEPRAVQDRDYVTYWPQPGEQG